MGELAQTQVGDGVEVGWLAAVLKPRAARLACWRRPFMAAGLRRRPHRMARRWVASSSPSSSRTRWLSVFHSALRTSSMAGLGHVVLDTPPQLLVAHAQHAGGLAHRQALTHRQRQGLEQQREAAAFARPRHRDLAGLAAGRAAHARPTGMQPGLELEEVQVPPGARVAVMGGLIERTATRAGQPLRGAPDKQVNAMPGGVEIEWTGQLARASRLSAKGAHLWMAGTTLRVAQASTRSLPHPALDPIQGLGLEDPVQGGAPTSQGLAAALRLSTGAVRDLS